MSSSSLVLSCGSTDSGQECAGRCRIRRVCLLACSGSPLLLNLCSCVEVLVLPVEECVERVDNMVLDWGMEIRVDILVFQLPRIGTVGVCSDRLEGGPLVLAFPL